MTTIATTIGLLSSLLASCLRLLLSHCRRRPGLPPSSWPSPPTAAAMQCPPTVADSPSELLYKWCFPYTVLYFLVICPSWWGVSLGDHNGWGLARSTRKLETASLIFYSLGSTGWKNHYFSVCIPFYSRSWMLNSYPTGGGLVVLILHRHILLPQKSDWVLRCTTLPVILCTTSCWCTAFHSNQFITAYGGLLMW